MSGIRRSALALGLSFGAWLGPRTAAAQETSIPLADARKAFEEARAASAADAGALWGRVLYGPMLFADPQTRAVVANQPDAEGRLTEKDGVFLGTLPEQEGISNTARRWAGVTWTMVQWPLPRNRYARTRLMLHECFHRIQEGIGIPGANPANSHLDGRDGRVWLRLEWRALAEALIRRGEARRKAVEDALVFRAYRRSLVSGAAQQERALELNEGLSEYTGVKLCGWPAEIQADRAALRLEQDERSDSFVRAFAYASGPAYGLLLDESGVDWRRKLTPETDLGELLGKALDSALPADLAGEAARRASAYDGALVLAEEEARAEQQREALARNRSRFVDGPVLLLPLGENLNYTFDPYGVEDMGDLGTVYRPTRMTDVWGVLEASDGALLSRGKDGKLATARVPAPKEARSGPTISGEGWTLTLNPGWKLAPGPRPGDSTAARD
jgi:hypothetical protein